MQALLPGLYPPPPFNFRLQVPRLLCGRDYSFRLHRQRVCGATCAPWNAIEIEELPVPFVNREGGGAVENASASNFPKFTFSKTTRLTRAAGCPCPTLDVDPDKVLSTSAGTNQPEQSPRPGPEGDFSGATGHATQMSKENFVLEAGNSML